LLPVIAALVMFGLLAVACANLVAARGALWADPLFFVGLLLIVVPIALRLFAERPTRHERLGLVILLGMALFACKLLRDPLRVGAYDEFLHLRTADDILLTGTVFSPNTLLGVSPFYPGLELITTALSDVSGLPLFEAGVLALAAARLVFVLALGFFFEMATGSARVAAIATLIYMLNPKFLYFNAQFSYETLALPLAALVLFLLVRRGHAERHGWIGLTILLLLTIVSVVSTHHVTSTMLSGFLVLWGGVAVVLRKRDPFRAKPGRIAVFAIFVIVAWTTLVATATIGYLGPAVSSTVLEMARLIAGELDARALFVTRAGEVAPLWERLTGSASAAVVLLLLPLGLLVVRSRYRSSAIVVALSMVSLAYPATLLARFTRVGAEVATRTPEFLFLGIGLVAGLALARVTYRGVRGIALAGAAALMVAVLAAGGVIVGVAPWARLPGPYLVSADARSVESEGIAAAIWARNTLGTGNAIVADRVNRMLMSAYGLQNLVTTYETDVPVRRLYITPEIGPVHRQIIAEGHIQYLLTDQRLTTALPVVGHYFDRGEEVFIGRRQTPLDPVLLSKFDRLPEVHRVFDSGNIQLYDVSGLAAAPSSGEPADN
jgi:hypothetical protein